MTLRYIACAKNENEGEQITRIFLVDALKHTDGTLFGNYHLPVNNGTRECDLVLFNKFGVWILEVKNWRGLIKIDQRSWQRDDGLIQQSPLINVEIKAKKLATVLENAGFRNISVVGLVALAQSSAKLQNTDDVNNRDPRQDKIFHLGDRLIRAITGRKYLYKMTNRELNFKLMRS